MRVYWLQLKNEWLIMRRIFGFLVCVLISVVAVGDVGAQEAVFPAENVYTVEVADLQIMGIQWSPTGEYFALALSDRAGRGSWFAYDAATGAAVYDKPMIAWYGDDSRFLFEDVRGIGAYNLQTGAVDFRLPYEAIDFAGVHYQFLAWMTWFGDEPQTLIRDEIMIFDVSSLNEPITGAPNFFVYDSQTGAEIFSLADMFQPPVYLPEREQVVISRQSPTRLEIYDRATWEMAESLEGFVVPYGRRWWNEDGSRLLVAASDAPIEIAPPEGWDSQLWSPQDSSLTAIADVVALQWVVGQAQLMALNSDNDLVFYSAITGEIERVMEIDSTLLSYVAGLNEAYILIASEVGDGTRTYAAWDIAAETWIPLGNQGFGDVQLVGDVVRVVEHATYFAIHHLATGAVEVFEHGTPYLEFSADGRWAATLSYSPDMHMPRTLTLYDLETGSQFAREVEGDNNTIYLREDGAVFAVVDYGNQVLSMWRIND